MLLVYQTNNVINGLILSANIRIRILVKCTYSALSIFGEINNQVQLETTLYLGSIFTNTEANSTDRR